MRKLCLLSLIWIAAWQLAAAQQEQLYTQFMYNKLAWNPGYAGSFESPTLVAVYRNQFVGLEGAPKTVALSFNMPYNGERVNFGVNVMTHSIGITRILNLDLLPFTYRIPMRYGKLGIGFQVSIRQFSQNWSDSRLVTFDTDDDARPLEANNKIIVNPGIGVYYTSTRNNWYAGVAVPRVVPSSIDFSSIGDKEDISREVWHVNAMGGYAFKAGKDLRITPQVLLKYALGAPFQADINTTLLWKEKYSGGLSYRTGGGTSAIGESVDLQLGLQATEKIFVCLSYDLGLTPLRSYHKGSVELTARYWFNPPPPDDVIYENPY